MAINGTAKQFEVSWDETKNAINLIPSKAYTPTGGELEAWKNPTSKEATIITFKIYLSKQEVQLTAHNIGGSNYFKLGILQKFLILM
ncbi:MAG: hypothetical protein QHH06_00925 [Clostridiales bacterium]|jgi:hypothetical protein|nr:hypothetical protein [Eubacteriales bacterium]MDH7565032.1 hypothetical protein [Clostridiales bacterium]